MKIKVYGKPDCPNCDEMKNFLKEKGVEFTYVDLEDPELDQDEASTVMAESIIVSGGTLPIVRVGGNLFSTPEAMREFV